MATAAEIIRAGAARLAAAGFDTPRLDAEILARDVFGVDRTHLFLRLREPVEECEAAAIDALIARRLAAEPIAYLTGRREFMGMPFHVGHGVLIPRPETELLVEDALAWLEDQPGARVVDVGTGSGAIAISVAKLSPASIVFASDVSLDALRWATVNRDALDAAVTLIHGDLIDPFAAPIELLLANLPYLTPAQHAGARDLRSEPALALVSGPDGLDLIRRLIAGAPRVMAPDGAIALEIDPDQTAAVEALAREQFPGAIISTRTDLAGLARHVWIQLARRGTSPWDSQVKTTV